MSGSIDGQCCEICDECGFDGSLLRDVEVVRRYQDLPRRWDLLISQGEESLLRRRAKVHNLVRFRVRTPRARRSPGRGGAQAGARTQCTNRARLDLRPSQRLDHAEFPGRSAGFVHVRTSLVDAKAVALRHRRASQSACSTLAGENSTNATPDIGYSFAGK